MNRNDSSYVGSNENGNQLKGKKRVITQGHNSCTTLTRETRARHEIEQSVGVDGCSISSLRETIYAIDFG